MFLIRYSGLGDDCILSFSVVIWFLDSRRKLDRVVVRPPRCVDGFSNMEFLILNVHFP